MRFFSSSALPSAEKLRFAASCSAAETMFGFLPPPSRCLLPIGPGHSADAGHYLVRGFDKSIVLSCRMTRMLRRLAFVLLCGGKDFPRAARLLDRRDGGLRSAVNLDIQLGLEFTTAEQPHAILRASQDAGLHQRFGVDGVVGVEQLGVDRLLNAVEIDLGEFEPENIVEAALRQGAVQRHLATFEALDAHAGARGLALAAAAGGLALA